MEIITVNHIQHATEFEDGISNSLVASVAIVRMIVDEKDVKVSTDVNNNSNHNQDNIYGAVILARTQVAGQLSAGQLLHTHTQPFYCWSGICPGPPGSAGTRKVKPRRLKPIWIYWSKR